MYPVAGITVPPLYRRIYIVYYTIMDYEKLYNELLPKYEKLVEVDANKTKAIDEERSKRKAAEAKLSSQETLSKDHTEALEKENEALKANLTKKDEIIKERDTQVTQLTGELAQASGKAGKFDEHLTKTLADSMAKIPEDKQEFVKKALAGKSLDEQLELAQEFANQYTKPGDYNINP